MAYLMIVCFLKAATLRIWLKMDLYRTSSLPEVLVTMVAALGAL